MILNEGQLSDTNCPLPSQAFTIKNSPLAFEILSSRLYSDPSMAIVRELLTNAYDAQVIVGKENIPIKVHLPDYLDPYFSIRDYGIGLEKDEVMILYTSFFSSTKNATNDVTGCFGLGSKTPFSYTSGFTVNSYKNGYKYKFLMVKKDMLPQVIYTGVETTNEPNGLEIIISVEQKDCALFKNNFIKYLKYIPEIKTTEDKIVDRIHSDFAFYPFEGIEDFIQLNFYSAKRDCISTYNWFENIYLKQGQNIYNINKLLDDKIVNEKHCNVKLLSSLSHAFKLIIEVPIGTYEITPNRETLDSTSKTVDKLAKLLTTLEEQLFRYEIPSISRVFKNYMSLSETVKILKTDLFNEKVNSISRKNDYILCKVGIDSKNKYTLGWQKSWGGNVYEYRNGEIIRESSCLCSGLNLVIDIPLRQKNSKQIKLIYRLLNYADKFKIYDKILLNYIPVWTDITNTQSHTEVKRIINLKKALKEFNEVFDKPINVVFTNLNKIIRKYPNDSIPEQFKKKSKTTRKGVKMLIRHATVEDFRFIHRQPYDYYKHFTDFYDRDLVEESDLYYMYPVTNTIVLYNEHPITSNSYGKTFDWTAIITALGDLPNEETGNPSFDEFLSSYKSTAKSFVATRNIICIAKKNLKYFKDYITINVNDIIEYYRNIRICIRDYICDKDLYNLAMFVDQYIKYYSKEQRDKIYNSVLYKELKIVKKLYEKVNKYGYKNLRYSTSYYAYLADSVIKTKNIRIFGFYFENAISSLNKAVSILKAHEARGHYYANSSAYRSLTRRGRIELLKEFLKG